MSEVNYQLVIFMCIAIDVCYTLGFVMGQIYEQSKQKDKEAAEAEAKANKKIGRRR